MVLAGKIIIDNPWMPGRDGGPYHSNIRIIKNGHEEIFKMLLDNVTEEKHMIQWQWKLKSPKLTNPL